MPLPEPPRRRALKHSRSIDIQFFQRDDELWDVDAHFRDVKPFQLEEANSLVIPANRPLHDLWVRLTFDARATIVGAEVAFDHVPFTGYCEEIEKAYQRLIGLNLLSEFRPRLMERLGKAAGCTHLNELLLMLPSVAIQVLVFGEPETREKTAFQQKDEKPLHLDGCHALRTDGPVVARFYPNWIAVDLASHKEFN